MRHTPSSSCPLRRSARGALSGPEGRCAREQEPLSGDNADAKWSSIGLSSDYLCASRGCYAGSRQGMPTAPSASRCRGCQERWCTGHAGVQYCCVVSSSLQQSRACLGATQAGQGRHAPTPAHLLPAPASSCQLLGSPSCSPAEYACRRVRVQEGVHHHGDGGAVHQLPAELPVQRGGNPQHLGQRARGVWAEDKPRLNCGGWAGVRTCGRAADGSACHSPGPRHAWFTACAAPLGHTCTPFPGVDP